MTTTVKTAVKENKITKNPSTLLRLSGLSAVLSGLAFTIVGLFHPENVPSVVTSSTWINVHIVAILMGFFGLFGLAGLYTRQVSKSGWLALVGYLLFSIWLGIITLFSFVEAFILPIMAAELPAFVESFLGMFSSLPGSIDLGILPVIWNISGPMFILGPLVFAIATFRTAVLPRSAAVLMGVGALLVPAGAFLPPQVESLVLIPVGLSMAWLGYALFSERKAGASESIIDQRNAQQLAGKIA